MFKKTAIAALIIGFSGAASAAMYASAPAPACSAGNVTVPCEKNAWDISIDALYLRADSNQYSAAAGFKAKTGWGFKLEGSYHFGTGQGLDINWAHYNKGSGLRTGGRMYRSKFDLLNLDFTQDINVGESVDFKLLGGLQFAKVIDNGTGGAFAGSDFKTTGFGPRGGAMLTYNFGNGFGVYTDKNFALLTLKRKDRTGATADTHSTGLSTDQSIGISYTRAMAQGDLTVRLAWVANQIDANALTTTGWDGGLLGVKWVGNV